MFWADLKKEVTERGSFHDVKDKWLRFDPTRLHAVEPVAKGVRTSIALFLPSFLEANLPQFSRRTCRCRILPTTCCHVLRKSFRRPAKCQYNGLAVLPDRQTNCHANGTSHSLLREDRIARFNPLPVQCRCGAVSAAIVLSSQSPHKCRYPLFAFPRLNQPDICSAYASPLTRCYQKHMFQIHTVSDIGRFPLIKSKNTQKRKETP